MLPFRSPSRLTLLLGLVCLLPLQATFAQIPDLGTGRVPTLAPLVKEVTPAVVNISVQGKIREDNPLYQDPFFRTAPRAKAETTRAWLNVRGAYQQKGSPTSK